MKMKMRVCAVCFCAAFLSGCGTTAKFVYPDNFRTLTRISTAPLTDKTVAVTVFDDERGTENSAAPLGFAYLPFMPWGWVDYSRPDAARMFISINEFDFTPSEDLAKAAAVSLRRSGLFKDAFFTFGGDKDRTDLVLTGRVLSSKYHGRVFTYGLTGLLAPCLWLVGFPVGDSQNVVTIELQLWKKDRVIWDYSFDRDVKIWLGMYYQNGHDCLGYAALMQTAMNEAVRDLAKCYRENPKLFD